jgi:hypothetical protein
MMLYGAREMKMKFFTTFVIAATLILSIRANAAADSAWAQATYLKLPGPAYTVARSEAGNIIVGIEVLQKNDSIGGFCRSTKAIAPHAEPTYVCYAEVADGDDASEIYQSSRTQELQVTFYEGNEPLIGVRWEEVQAVVPRFGNDPLLCVKKTPVVPDATSNYNCYYPNRRPVGGAVSVGN